VRRWHRLLHWVTILLYYFPETIGEVIQQYSNPMQ